MTVTLTFWLAARRTSCVGICNSFFSLFNPSTAQRMSIPFEPVDEGKPGSPVADDAFTRLALFGATGQIGAAILDALLEPSFGGYEPHVKVFLRDEHFSDKADSVRFKHPRVELVKADFDNVQDLADKLEGTEAVVSALNGPGIPAQDRILDAAAQAGA